MGKGKVDLICTHELTLLMLNHKPRFASPFLNRAPNLAHLTYLSKVPSW